MDVRRAVQATELARIRTEPLRPRPEPTRARDASDGSVRVAISKPAGLLSQLASLQEADGTRFKHLMGAVGSNLKAAANPESGAVGEELGALADQLLKVAKTGDLSALQPVETSAIGSAGIASRALAAYRQNAPAPAAPSGHVQKALDYVLAAARADTP